MWTPYSVRLHDTILTCAPSNPLHNKPNRSCRHNCISVVMVSFTTVTPGWPLGILFAPKPTSLQPVWPWYSLMWWSSDLWCVSRFPGRATVCRSLLRAHIRWLQLEGIIGDMCQPGTTLRQQWEHVRGEKGRATPRNLTQPLWLRADVRKQLERSRRAPKYRRSGTGLWYFYVCYTAIVLSARQNN